MQYRINGIQLPEGISGFGQSVDSRFADRIDFVTGALPAQYGLRTAGIVDIETKEGSFMKPGGSLGLLAGGHDTFQPSAELVGSQGALSYYATANFLTNTLGIENPLPTRNAIHDRTEQTRGFGYLSYLVDDNTRLGLMAGTYEGRFQIPNNPGQAPAFSLAGISDVETGFNARPSAELDQRQREQNHYVVGSLQQTRGALDYQAALFYQYSTLHYLPDPQGGDLIYNGVASDAFKSNSAAGVQADASYKIVTDHTLRFGGAYTHQLTKSDNSVGVFLTDENGNPISNEPITIVDNSDKRGNLSSLYVQDEWRIDPRLTVNYGLRFDHVAAFTNEHQLSPRINALWKVTEATAAACRLFALLHAAAAGAGRADQHRSLPRHDQCAGSRRFRHGQGRAYALLRRRALAYHHAALDRRRRHVLQAHHQYARRRAVRTGADPHALQLRRRSRARRRVLDHLFAGRHGAATLNLAISKAKGKDIVSGQSLFGADELAYIADHFIYVDHDQRYSLSGGVTYRFGDNRVSADLVYGSGLRNTPDGAPPNSGKLPSYATMNVAYVRSWKESPVGSLETRVGVINLFDKTYLLRDGSGVGVGAPQYGERRTWFAAITKGF